MMMVHRSISDRPVLSPFYSRGFCLALDTSRWPCYPRERFG